MKKVHQFSLVELMVMVAILAIIMTLLSPSLNSITSASRSLVCSQNQSKLGTYISSYSFDNDDHFTPPGQKGKVWDDYLFGYDGRDQVLENWNVNFAYGEAPFSWGRWVDISGKEALFSTYECPEDPSEEFYPILKSLPARTYQINAHGGPWMRGVGWIDKSNKMVDVVDPSRFVVLTPAPRSHFFGSVGASYFSYIWVPEHSFDDPWTGHKSPLPKLGWKGLHSKQTFNYLMADGSVKNMIFEETYNTANSINMWNINGN